VISSCRRSVRARGDFDACEPCIAGPEPHPKQRQSRARARAYFALNGKTLEAIPAVARRGTYASFWGSAPALLRARARHHSSCVTLRLRFNLPQPGVSIIRAAPHFSPPLFIVGRCPYSSIKYGRLFLRHKTTYNFVVPKADTAVAKIARHTRKDSLVCQSPYVN